MDSNKHCAGRCLLPADRFAIVVSADIAEYELGSSGEPTQGAGAVAMLVGQQPTLLEIDPRFSGSASVDRETDFENRSLINLRAESTVPAAVIFPSSTVPTRQSATLRRSAMHSLTS